MPIFRRNFRRLFPWRDMTSVPSTVRVPWVMSCIRLMVRIRVEDVYKRQPGLSRAAATFPAVRTGADEDHFGVPHLAAEITQVAAMPSYAAMEKIIGALS